MTAFLTQPQGVDSQGRNNHERVGVINTALRVSGVSTWFDSSAMSGDIAQCMATGIGTRELPATTPQWIAVRSDLLSDDDDEIFASVCVRQMHRLSL